jgi:hypothetical protein
MGENHLSEMMRISTLHHTEMAGDLATLRVAVYPTVESALRRWPAETFWVEVAGELVAEFQRLEEWCSRLEQPGARIYDLLLGPPLDQA